MKLNFEHVEMLVYDALINCLLNNREMKKKKRN